MKQQEVFNETAGHFSAMFVVLKTVILIQKQDVFLTLIKSV